MIEKVNPSHPDKVADRIAGALVDHAYTLSDKPKVAFEVLVGHGLATIIGETDVQLHDAAVESIVHRLVPGDIQVNYLEVPQDPELATNQAETVKAGDNGIFKGVPISDEVKKMSDIARRLYERFPSDGKYILSDHRLIVCQSNASNSDLDDFTSGLGFGNNLGGSPVVLNPLGDWTGGTDVDTGAVNRKLGSDMGDAVTGGGLHGKDLTKGDVSLNIYAHLKAQATGEVVELHCAIGDELIDGLPYEEIVARAKDYIQEIGGFEKLAEWGLV